MSEYTNVEHPFLEKLREIKWQVIDKGSGGIPQDPAESMRTSFSEVALERHNAEFSPIEVHRFTKSHDRFLIIDSDVYHIGASIKDLGKKRFAFCKMRLQADDILRKLAS